jgi:hypothetical protein
MIQLFSDNFIVILIAVIALLLLLWVTFLFCVVVVVPLAIFLLLDIISSRITPKTTRKYAIEQIDQAMVVKLRDMIVLYFSEEEVKDICFVMNIDYDNLPGEEKLSKTRELLQHCKRRGRVSELTHACNRLYPNTDWTYMIESRKEILQ